MNTYRTRANPGGRLAPATLLLATLYGCGTEPSGLRGGSLPLAATAQEEVHWEYEGELGPDHWGELDPSFAACSQGLRQSPIDIVNARRSDVPEIRVRYEESEFDIVNNGHTIQVNYDPGSFLRIGDTRYELLQYHFHHPSEHTVDGRRFPLELHLVHRNAVGELAVLGVLIGEGAHNPAFHPLWDNLPTVEGERHVDVLHDAGDMLSGRRSAEEDEDDEEDDEDGLSAYRYAGSLTTPPCTEGVRWNVLTVPVEISAEQIEAFAAIFELNSRPLQPLNERPIRVDDSER